MQMVSIGSRLADSHTCTETALNKNFPDVEGGTPPGRFFFAILIKSLCVVCITGASKSSTGPTYLVTTRLPIGTLRSLRGCVRMSAMS